MTPCPKPDATARWQQADREHHLHPFTNHAALAEKGVRVITHADGAYIWDSAGNRLLDGMAGLWSVAIGYGRDELAVAAEAQLRKLPYYNCFFQSAHPPVIELAQRLARLTPDPLAYAFFANSGSEANDTAVKMVRYYWDVCGKPDKKTIISRKYAFHGSTLAASSLSGLPSMYARVNLPLPLFEHVEAPYWYEFGRLAFAGSVRRRGGRDRSSGKFSSLAPTRSPLSSANQFRAPAA